MKLLEINHLKKYFGELEVLKDISMSVEEGEVVSIIGPSGSGKSTLLRCATMLETMNGGGCALRRYSGCQTRYLCQQRTVGKNQRVLRTCVPEF